MIDNDSELIWEAYDQSDDLMWFYHGGRKWEKYQANVPRPKKGRYEAGAGIYLTNSYETARKYAKGSNIVSKVGVRKNITLAKDVYIPKEDVIRFIKTFIGPKNRKKFLMSVEQYEVKEGVFPAYYLINLSVNYEVGGKQAMEIMEFVVEHGVDASFMKQSGEEVWLVVHNPEIIEKVIHTKPSDIPVDDYLIPMSQ